MVISICACAARVYVFVYKSCEQRTNESGQKCRLNGFAENVSKRGDLLANSHNKFQSLNCVVLYHLGRPVFSVLCHSFFCCVLFVVFVATINWMLIARAVKQPKRFFVQCEKRDLLYYEFTWLILFSYFHSIPIDCDGNKDAPTKFTHKCEHYNFKLK